MKTKHSIITFAVASALATMSPIAYSFEANTKPITTIIPFAAGGGVDQSFRHLQKYAEQKGIKLLGAYKPGAEGMIGMSDVATLPLDGFNISITTAGTIAAYRLKNPNSDLHIVSAIRTGIFSIVVNPNKGITSLKDLETRLRNGEDIKFGQGATAQKLSIDQLLEFINPKTKAVVAAYKGAGPLLQDLVGGHVDVAIIPLGVTSPLINTGKLKLLAVSAESKVQEYPDAPLITTVYPRWENYEGFCLVVPKNTNPDALAFWEEFLKSYLNDPQVKKEFLRDFTEASVFKTPKLENTIQANMRRLSKLKGEDQ